MTIMDIAKTALRYVPDALVPGAKPEPLRGKHGQIGEPISRWKG
jgi:hypothetical protein